jgi:outer membrane protein OmpU
MNKLTKVGCSALCGSLAAISAANAGELTVTGGVDMSWLSNEGGSSTTGNPIGIGSNLTFTGSGELDNGWTFGLTVAHLNKAQYSSAAVNIDMLGLGKLNVNQGDSGNGIDAYDDKMPTAWEEPWGAGMGTGVKLVSGVGPNMNIQYTTPKILGFTIAVAHAPQMGATDTNDKGSSGSNSTLKGKGYDATINLNPTFGTEALSGLNLFVGGHYTEIYDKNTASGNNRNDHYEGVVGMTLDIGPVSLGLAASGVNTGKVGTTDVDYYRNTMYGVAFNVNDDLSVSYSNHESDQNLVSDGDINAGGTTMEMESWQAAYSMGGASIRIADLSVENASYQTTTQYDKDAKVLSVSLAF